jgi:hypothetical protein
MDSAELIKRDIAILFAIQDYCYQRPKLDALMRSIVSKWPHQDIVLIVYLFFILGVLEIGHIHFWLCALNLSTSFAVRKLIAAKRPVEYNRALMPITDIAAESYG